MIKHSFKIGNRVKLKYPNRWSMSNLIGIVVRFDTQWIRVDWGGKEKWTKDYPHLPGEIESIVKVGEQLMFNFMLKGE